MFSNTTATRRPQIKITKTQIAETKKAFQPAFLPRKVADFLMEKGCITEIELAFDTPIERFKGRHFFQTLDELLEFLADFHCNGLGRVSFSYSIVIRSDHICGLALRHTFFGKWEVAIYHQYQEGYSNMPSCFLDEEHWRIDDEALYTFLLEHIDVAPNERDKADPNIPKLAPPIRDEA